MKENIRKVIVRKKKEQKKKYKTLRLQAFDTNWKMSQQIRKQEDYEWKKFKFLCNLQDALDKKE